MINRRINFLPDSFDRLKEIQRYMEETAEHPLTNDQVVAKALEITHQFLIIETSEGNDNERTIHTEHQS